MHTLCQQGCSEARTPFPWIFLCGNGVPIDVVAPVGTEFVFYLVTTIVPNAQAQRWLLDIIEEIKLNLQYDIG